MFESGLEIDGSLMGANLSMLLGTNGKFRCLIHNRGTGNTMLIQQHLEIYNKF